MIVEKREPLIPGWVFNAERGFFWRRVTGEDGISIIQEDDFPPIRILLDIGTACHVAERFKPNYERRTEPYCQAKFEVSDEINPETGQPFEKYAIGIPFISSDLPNQDLHLLLARGVYAQRAVSDLIALADGSPPACDNQLPVVVWEGSHEVEAKKGPGRGRKFLVPTLSIIGWLPRPDEFGERLNPLPPKRARVPLDQFQVIAAPEPVKADPVKRKPTKAARISNVLPREPGGGAIEDDCVPFQPCKE